MATVEAAAPESAVPGPAAPGPPGPEPAAPARAPARARKSAVREGLRIFRMAAWLGWQAESNWTDPWLFAIYSVIKPVAGTLILVLMFHVARREGAPELFWASYVGNAFYIYVGQLLWGVSWVVLGDREHFQTLKYMFIASPSMGWYLVGRAVAKFAVATIAVVIVLGFGAWALGIPLSWSAVHWPLFWPVFGLGIVSTAALGMLLAGVSLISSNHGAMASESVAGALYLFAGVVFPVDVLPPWLQPVSLALPYTYWMESLRRAVLGRGMSPALAAVSDGRIFWILVLTTAGMVVLGGAFYRWAETLARRRGLIDQVTWN